VFHLECPPSFDPPEMRLPLYGRFYRVPDDQGDVDSATHRLRPCHGDHVLREIYASDSVTERSSD